MASGAVLLDLMFFAVIEELCLAREITTIMDSWFQVWTECFSSLKKPCPPCLGATLFPKSESLFLFARDG